MTTENNKIIAEFMGATLIKDLKYHLDWNWLMEVVEKIESLGYKVDISKWGNSQYCGIYLNGKKISGNETNTKIEAVYNASLEFIKWYNENKN